MGSTIGFETVQNYLSGFAQLGTIGNSPHKAFWKVKRVNGVTTPATYADFINDTVPGVADEAGAPIPILRKDAPLLSPFFLILKDPSGFGGNPQMLPTGVFLTDPAVSISLPDGTTVTGPQVLHDLEVWLSNGFPEHPAPLG